MAKYRIIANVDYLIGHLRYGHYEGEIDEEELPPNWEEELRKHPSLIKQLNLELIVDDYEIDGTGDISDIQIEKIEEDE